MFAKISIAIALMSSVSFCAPVFGQVQKSKCSLAESKVLERLARDKIALIEAKDFVSYVKSDQTAVILRTIAPFNAGDSPTNRVGRRGISFTGKKAVALLRSPAILNELASTMFKGCPNMAALTFGIHATGYQITFGMESNGEIKRWGCYEDIGFFPGRQQNTASRNPPKWGYHYCSI